MKQFSQLTTTLLLSFCLALLAGWGMRALTEPLREDARARVRRLGAALWVVAVLVVPRASVLLAARSVDVPSTDHMLSQRSRLFAQLWREDQKEIGDFLQNAFGSGPEPEDTGIATAFNEKFDELAEARQGKLRALDSRLAEERRNRQLASP